MANYILSCCSTADISNEHFEKRDMHYVCFHFSLDGKEYPDDLGKSISYEDFYAAMDKGADTKTSQVSIQEYVDFFTPFMEQGLDVVHATLSSGISGSYNSARNAANIMMERYPERKVYVVDSLAASSGYGLFMDWAADQRDAGLSAEELADWMEKNKLRVNHWFFSTDLSYFVKGGRISKASAVFGGILEICPLMNVDYQGRLIPRYKIRTKKKVIREIVKRMEENAEGGYAYNGKCYMSNSACLADAKAVADQIEALFPAMKGKIEINSIGTTIGAHTGPGTVALFFVGSERVD